MSQVRLSDLIIDKHKSLFKRNTKIRHTIMYGGRGGTKTTSAGNKVTYSRYEVPFSSAIVIRKHANKIGRSVFNEIHKSCQRFNLLENTHYKKKQSPFEFEFFPQGNKIYFSGIDSIDDIKGMVDPKFPIKEIWIEEVTEFFNKSVRDGEQLINNIIATFTRGGDEDFDPENLSDKDADFNVYYTFNPPENPNAPVMQWVEKMRKREDTEIIFTTYLDAPPRWLGQTFYLEAETLKKHDEELYRNIYLGECVGIQGRIYRVPQSLIVKPTNDYDFYSSAIDIGESKSATTFTWVGYKFENARLNVTVLEEFHHRNSEVAQQDIMDFQDYANSYVDFFRMNVSKYGIPQMIMTDHDVMFKQALRKAFTDNNLNYSLVRFAIKNKITDRIKAFKLMMSLGQLTFSENVPITIQAFKDALWNEKKASVGIDERLDDLTTNIDSIDCTEYAVEPYFNRILDSALWRKRE